MNRSTHHHSSRSSRRGFTLVELILYMGLYIVLLSIIASILISVLEVHVESQTANAVEQEGRYILQRLRHDVSRCTQVTVPSSSGQSSDTLTCVIDGVTYHYSLSDNVLSLARGSDTNRMHSPDTRVTYFTVERFGTLTGTPSFRFHFTLDDAHTAHENARSFTTTIGLRL